MKGKTRRPHYGRLNVANICRETYRIWLSREHDLPDLEPSLIPWQADADHLRQLMMRDLAQKLLDQLALNDKEQFVLLHRVLDEWTLDEVGESLCLSKERIRQMEFKILMRLQRLLQKMTGLECSFYRNSAAAKAFALGDA